MLIRKGRHEADFTILPNRTLRDDRLTHMARGVLAELLSRPDGWETTADRMWQQARIHRGDGSRGEGKPAYRRAFADLEKYGYLERTREQDERGHWRTVMVVYDRPRHRRTDNRTSDNRTSDNWRSDTSPSLGRTVHEGLSNEGLSPSNSPAAAFGGPASATAERAREGEVIDLADWTADPWQQAADRAAADAYSLAFRAPWENA